MNYKFILYTYILKILKILILMISKKFVIYTCLFGHYDKLKTPLIPDKKFDYVCFTNNKNLKSKFWNIININENDDNLYLSRKLKILPHKYLINYDKSIYIDSNIVFVANPNYLIDLLSFDDLILFEHPKKFRLLDEINEVYNSKIIDKKTYLNILAAYSNYIFFNINSKKIISTNRIIVRNHKKKSVIILMNKWWDAYKQTFFKRDQIVLPLIMNSINLKIKIISSQINYYNFYFVRPHLNTKLAVKIRYYGKFFLPEFFFRLVCFFSRVRNYKINL